MLSMLINGVTVRRHMEVEEEQWLRSTVTGGMIRRDGTESSRVVAAGE